MEDQIWSARDREVIARTKQYVEESKSLKVEVEESESSLGPEDSDLDFTRILEKTRDKKGCAIFDTISTDGLSAFLVVSRARGVCSLRGSKTRLLQRAEDSGKRSWKGSVLLGARRYKRGH